MKSGDSPAMIALIAELATVCPNVGPTDWAWKRASEVMPKRLFSDDGLQLGPHPIVEEHPRFRGGADHRGLPIHLDRSLIVLRAGKCLAGAQQVIG